MTGPQGNAVPLPELQRLVALELDRIRHCATQVDELRRDQTFQRLSSRRLSGETARMWNTAHTDFLLIEKRLAKWRATVTKARDLVGTPQSPGPKGGVSRETAMEQARQLLYDRSVPLARDEMLKEDRPPPASTSQERDFSLAYVRTANDNALEAVRQLVNGAAAVWTSVLPHVERLATRLHRVESSFGAVTSDQDRAILTELRARLEELRSAAETDPLAQHGGESSNRGRPRDPRDLDRIDDELTDIHDLLSSTVTAEQRTAALTDWRRLLRTRFEIYRTRAERRGIVFGSELAGQFDRARKALRADPFDLDAAEAAVQEFCGAVWWLDSEDD